VQAWPDSLERFVVLADSLAEKKNERNVCQSFISGHTLQVVQQAQEPILMNKPEVEALLEELDAALVQAFPGPKPMSVLLVGGAGLLLQGRATRPVESVDVIIVEMMGSQESTLVFHSPIADKVRRIIKDIGRRHGFKGEQQLFLNDDGAPFFLELSEHELPPMRLLKAYRKLHLFIPCDLGYLLACKLMIVSPERHGADIAILCQALGIQNRVQAQHLVNQYFPSSLHQAFYQLPRTLNRLFGQ
jgi:hypothetical protein